MHEVTGVWFMHILFPWLAARQIEFSTNKPQIIRSILHSKSISFESFFLKNSLVMYIYHRAQVLNPDLSHGNCVCHNCVALPLRDGPNYWANFIHFPSSVLAFISRHAYVSVPLAGGNQALHIAEFWHRQCLRFKSRHRWSLSQSATSGYHLPCANCAIQSFVFFLS